MSRSYHDFYPQGDSARLVETKYSGDWLTAIGLYALIAAAIITAWGV